MLKLTSFLFLIITYLAFSLLAGCVSIMPMKAQDKQAIHTVSVDRNIAVPEEMYLVTPSMQALTGTAGLAGIPFGMNMAKHQQAKLQDFVKTNNIKIDQIVYVQVIQQLKNNTNMKVIAGNSADARLIVRIQNYGLSIPHGFTPNVIPVLSLKATLVRNNQVVWSYSNPIEVWNTGLQEYPFAKVYEDPKYLNLMWNAVTEKVVKNMISTL